MATVDNGGNRAQRRAAPHKAKAVRSQRTAGQDDGGTLLEQALAAQNAGRLDEAEQIYRALITQNPRHRPALNNLGVVCRRLGQPRDAAEFLERALALAPEDGRIHANLGLALYDAGVFGRAIPHLRRAVDHRPHDAVLLLRLSRACIYSDQNDEAAIVAQRLVDLVPNDATANRHLAWTLVSTKRLAEAREGFAKALSLAPEDTESAYMLTVLDGETPPVAAHLGVVRGSYDSTAANYDDAVVPVLQNRTPQLLRALLDEATAPDLRLENTLDLACGTGLMGLRLRPLTGRLTGVDLSPGMVREAERKGIYDRLEVGDAVAFLDGDEGGAYDLFSCSDALIHFGDLAPLFDAVAARSRPKALFVFSVEHRDGEGYALDRASVRYQHSFGYITSLLRGRGWAVRAHRLGNVRVDRGVPVTGGLYAAEAPS